MPSIRLSLVLVSAASALSIIAALIMQYQFGMEPCPLCISQRIMVICVGVAAAIGAAFTFASGAIKRWGVRASSLLGIACAGIGGYISARHVWIQNLPEDEVPICGPGLEYMFQTRPLFDALSLLFTGDGHCAEISFLFLGLSIPAWTLVLFITFATALMALTINTFRSTEKVHVG